MNRSQHKVSLQPSGRIFEVEPGEAILVAALREHISLPYGCRMGTCRTCRGKVIEGSVDHADSHPSYLTEAQRAEGYALLCRARPLGDVTVEIEELPPLPEPQIAQALLKRSKLFADDVMWLNLRLPLHLNLRFAAGQYIDLFLADGTRRSYSIANAPRLEGAIDLELHVRHLPGGRFTDPLFAGEVKTRTMFDFEGPLGTFYLRDGDRPVILLATGTGYAPIRSILLDALSRDDQRRFSFYWGGRQESDIYAAQEIANLIAGHDNLSFIPVLSRAKPDLGWYGRTGYVHDAVRADFPNLSGHDVYACGSPAMIEAARADFTGDGSLPAESFFADSFVTEAERAALP